eukprot:Partr_v1_DN28973_c0_g1_i3_m24893
MSDTEPDFASASEGEFEESPRSNSPLKSPAVAEASEAEVKETPAPAQASGGWGGWGAFLSSAVNAVSESLQSDMDGLITTAKDLGDGIKKVTEDSMDAVYETLDPEAAASSAKAPPTASSPTSPSSNSTEHENSAKVVTRGITKSTETVLSAIDKTLDFTSDLLGTAVTTSFQTIENAKLGERLGELNARGVVDQSRQTGEVLMKHGLTALEAIGSVIGMNAAKSLAEQRGRVLNQQESSGSVGGGGVSQQKKKRVPKLADYFEDNCGNAHLQALEMLGTEAEIKVAEMDAGDLEGIADLHAAIDSGFSSVEIDGDATISRILDHENFQAILKLLSDINVPNTSQLEQLRQQLEKHSESSNVKHAQFVETYSADNVEGYFELATKDSQITCADLAEKSCEQFLRISEIMLMLIAEDRIEKREPAVVRERCLQFQKALGDLCTALLTEVSLITHDRLSYIDAIPATEQDDELTKSVAEFRKNLDTARDDTCVYIKEALHSTALILKLMALSAAVKTSDE